MKTAIAAALGALVVALGVAGWARMSSIRSVERTKAELEQYGIRLELGVVHHAFVSATTEHARATLSNRLNAVIEELEFPSWFTKHLRVSDLQLSLVGCPAQLFEDWRKVTVDVGERLEVAHADVEWNNRLFGRLYLDGVRQRTIQDG